MVISAMMLALILASWLQDVPERMASTIMEGRRAISTNAISVDGPAIVDRTQGRFRVYVYRADWHSEIKRIRAKLAGQKDLEEFSGFCGMLYHINSSDHSFHWGVGRIHTIGMFRGLRGSAQKISHLFDPEPKGAKARGWMTVLTFDGEIVDLPR